MQLTIHLSPDGAVDHWEKVEIHDMDHNEVNRLKEDFLRVVATNNSTRRKSYKYKDKDGEDRVLIVDLYHVTLIS